MCVPGRVLRVWGWVAAAAALAAVVARAAGQARPPRCLRPGVCVGHIRLPSHYTFEIQGREFNIDFFDGDSVTLKCHGNLTLPPPGLLAFETALVVDRVKIVDCPATRYGDALAALNVSVPRGVTHLTLQAARGPLAPDHLAALRPLRRLTLSGGSPLAAPAGPRAAVLGSLAALEVLTVTGTPLPDGELAALPAALRQLSAAGAGVTRVPAALVARLRLLRVSSPAGVRVERAAGGELRHLDVLAPDAALLAEWSPPALETAVLWAWPAKLPPPVPACARLLRLELVSPALEALPARWVARCTMLGTLAVRKARGVTALPPALLADASALTSFSWVGGALTSLPVDLFDDTVNLTHVNLGYNHLKEFPSGLLSGAGVARLSSLEAGHNALGARAALALAGLRALTALRLSHNPLGDFCRDDSSLLPVHKSESQLASLTKLEKLWLDHSNVSVICSDWRTKLRRLALLDLSATAVAVLTYEDLVEYERDVPAAVLLDDTPLRAIYFNEADLERALQRARRGAAVVAVSARRAALACDCYLYWAARAVAEGAARLEGACFPRAAAPGAAAALACAVPAAAGCPARCACSARRGGAELRVECAGAASGALPALPADVAAYAAVDLLLADAGVSTLDAARLPPNLRELDLRNNSIVSIDERTAARLAEGAEHAARRVRLAGNPLACACAERRALRRLLAAPGLLAPPPRCAAGAPLSADTFAACDVGADASLVAPLAIAALAVIALALAAAFGRRAALRALKAVGRRVRRADAGSGAPPGLPYDAFVAFVGGGGGGGGGAEALEVAAALEAGGRRVLVAERDWLPPAEEAACVAASVRAARCTVALASAAWERALARDAMRAAYDAAWRGRLVLVLGPRPAPLAEAARRYAREYPHLVVRRGPGFERRLARAVGPPRPRGLSKHSL